VKRMTQAKEPNGAKERAEASFKKKERRAQEGAEGMAAYKAAARAVEEKTARLRALRLAKEKAERKSGGKIR
jgi:hypothetical protein